MNLRRFSPRLFLALFAVWLLLNQSLAPLDLLLGALLAGLIQLFIRPLQTLPPARIRKPHLLLRIVVVAFIDIVRSALAVGYIILSRRPKNINSQFIAIPLTLRDPYALAILSCIINTTPGTVWAEILPGRNDLALHVFDLRDAAWWVETIKRNYEQPLLAVFEGRDA